MISKYSLLARTILTNLSINEKLHNGLLDPTLFQKKNGDYLMLFKFMHMTSFLISIDLKLTKEFKELMKIMFEISMMDKINFLLGLNITQSGEGIFINTELIRKDSIQKSAWKIILMLKYQWISD